MSKRISALVFMALMLAAFITGCWLLITPWLERRDLLIQQEKLMEIIEAGDAEIGADEDITPVITVSPQATKVESIEPVQAVTKNESLMPGTPVITSAIPTISASAIEFHAPFPTGPPFQPLSTEPPDTPEPLPDSEFPDAIVGLGILTIDKINLRLPVAEGVSEAGLKIALGHVPYTAAIGETGNAVIAGHRSYDYGLFFNRLDEMAIGDVIAYQAKNGEITHYAVFEIAEIYPDDQIAFIQPQDASVITLYTCTPIRVATRRLIVRAEKIID